MASPIRSRWQASLLIGALVTLGLLALWAAGGKLIGESEADQVVQEARTTFRANRFKGVDYLSTVIEDADARGFSTQDVERFEKLKSQLVREMKQGRELTLNVEVECDGPAACRTRAVESFREAEELLSSADEDLSIYAEASAKLLLAHYFLVEGEIWEVPREFDGWNELYRKTREPLDQAFTEFRMRFHQAHSREETDKARQVLEEIKINFPVPGSREYEWAVHREQELGPTESY